MRFIYRYEAKGIQRWILATGRLGEIKGASAAIESLSGLLEDALAAQGEGAEVLYSAAGGATVRFPDSASAADFSAHWPMLVSTCAPGLQVVQASVADGDNAFGRLQLALRADRSRLVADLPEAGPVSARSPRTGLPAENLDSDRGPKGDTLEDAATRIRRKGARGNQEAMAIRVWKEADAGEAPQFYGDTEDFGEGCRLAVVYADGNDLGLRLESLQSSLGLEGLARFSTHVSTATARALTRAIEGVTDAVGEAAARPVVVAGDDMAIILRAKDAIGFARDYLAAFEEESASGAEEFGGGLTATAGIAFIHQKHPFSLAHDLAHDLCKTAKKRTRNSGSDGATPSTLLFHRVTTALSGGYEQIEARELTVRSDSDRLLAHGPYAIANQAGLPTVDGLKTLARALDPKKMSTGSVREAIEAFHDSATLAANRLERIEQVLCESDKDGEKKWNDFAAALRGLGCDDDGWSVVENEDGKRTTPLVDAATLRKEMPLNSEKEKVNS
jgi:hypothetical protein